MSQHACRNQILVWDFHNRPASLRFSPFRCVRSVTLVTTSRPHGQSLVELKSLRRFTTRVTFRQVKQGLLFSSAKQPYAEAGGALARRGWCVDVVPTTQYPRSLGRARREIAPAATKTGSSKWPIWGGFLPTCPPWDLERREIGLG